MRFFSFIITLLLLFTSFICRAQTDSIKHWQLAGDISLHVNQVHLENWAPGGQSSLSLLGSISYHFNYQKDRVAWINQFSGYFGGIKAGKGADLQKNHDFFEYNSRLSIAHKKRTHYVFFGNVITQVAKGYLENNKSKRVSSFFAPAYLTEGIGVEYRSLKYSTDSLFFAVISPLAVKHTIVSDPMVDGTIYGLSSANGVKSELGLYFQTGLKKKILERTILSTQLQLYTNYLNDFGNIDVNWKTILIVEANKWINIQLMTHLVFDDDTMQIAFTDLDADGFAEVTASGPKLQFMEVLGVGIVFKL